MSEDKKTERRKEIIGVCLDCFVEKCAIFNPVDCFLSAGEYDFLLGGKVVIDAAVLQLRRRAEILCGGDRQPLFNKAIEADGDDFPSSFGFLVFVQAMTSLFRLTGILMIRAYHTLRCKSSSRLNFVAYFFLGNHS